MSKLRVGSKKNSYFLLLALTEEKRKKSFFFPNKMFLLNEGRRRGHYVKLWRIVDKFYFKVIGVWFKA